MKSFIYALGILAAVLFLPSIVSAQTYTVNPGDGSLASAVSSMQPGDTIILNGGVYRETINLPSRTWSASTPTTIKAATGATVTIKGSNVVTGWVSQGGGVWRKDSWTTNSQQVFLNGTLLQQIGGEVMKEGTDDYYPTNPNNSFNNINTGGENFWPARISGNQNNLVLNSFYYDRAASKLYVKVNSALNLNNETVEVSVRGKFLNGDNISGLTVKDLNFMHSNTTDTGRDGAFRIVGGGHNVIDNISITYADGTGISLRGDYNEIKNSSFNYNGYKGLAGSGEFVKVHDNEINHNNTRGFNTHWDAGALKFMGSTGDPGAANGLKNSEFYNNNILFNTGNGAWFDTNDGGNKVYHNVAAYNTQSGIMYEIASGDGYIYDNYSFGNGVRGYYISGSNDILVAHNLAAFNPDGITVVGRTGNTNPTLNNVIGNVSVWNTGNQLIMPASISTNTADYNLFESVNEPQFSLGSSSYTGLSAWRTASGVDTNSWRVLASAPSSIQTAINNQVSNIDWTDVLTTAASYTVQGSDINGIKIGGVAPGPYSTISQSGNPGVTIVDDTDTTAITYSGTWNHITRAGTFDDTISVSNTTGDYAQYTFTGTTVQLYTQVGAGGGIFDIYLDGVKQTSFDSYSANQTYQILAYENTSLSNASHTIKMVVTGTKNASATNYYSHIDRIVTTAPVVTTTDDADTTAITYSGTWNHNSDSQAFDGTVSVSNTTNNYMDYTFTGTTVQVYSKKGPSAGIFDIYLDGVKQTSFDSYSAAAVYQVLAYENTSLSNGSHTIKIVVTGTKNASSTNYYSHLDKIVTSKPSLNVIDDADTTAIAYTGTWNHISRTGTFDDTISVSSTTGDYVQYAFTGTTVEFYTQVGTGGGIFDIYIDGVKQTSFDSYSAAQNFQILAYQNTSLSNGTHTIKMVVTGTKNASSTNYYSHIDRIVTR